MLRPLNVISRPAPPTVSAGGVDVSSIPQTALAKVCQVEYVAIRTKTEREKEPSLYTIELFLCAPGSINAMLTPTWKIDRLPDEHEPDVRLDKTFQQIFQLHDDVKALVAKCAHGKQRCPLCQSLYVFIRDRAVGWHMFNRMLMDTKDKFKLMQLIVAKFVYLLVRAQRPPRPNIPFRPSCEHLAELAELMTTFLEL